MYLYNYAYLEQKVKEQLKNQAPTFPRIPEISEIVNHQEHVLEKFNPFFANQNWFTSLHAHQIRQQLRHLEFEFDQYEAEFLAVRMQKWQPIIQWKNEQTMQRMKPLGMEFSIHNQNNMLMKKNKWPDGVLDESERVSYLNRWGRCNVVNLEFHLDEQSPAILMLTHSFLTTRNIKEEFENRLQRMNPIFVQKNPKKLKRFREIIQVLHDIDMEATLMAKQMGVGDWFDFD